MSEENNEDVVVKAGAWKVRVPQKRVEETEAPDKKEGTPIAGWQGPSQEQQELMDKYGE